MEAELSVPPRGGALVCAFAVLLGPPVPAAEPAAISAQVPLPLQTHPSKGPQHLPEPLFVYERTNRIQNREINIKFYKRPSMSNLFCRLPLYVGW